MATGAVLEAKYVRD
ncbi:unnamed protein product, partial [Rotaria sordida]